MDASERVPQDVQLGYWLSRHPSLCMALPRKTGWADAFRGDHLRRLLGARIPWDQLGWVTGARSAWRAASHVRWRLVCGRAAVSCGAVCARERAGRVRRESYAAAAAAAHRRHVCQLRRWDGGRDDESAKGEKYTRTPGWIEAASYMRRGVSGGQCNYTRSAMPELPHAGMAT